MHVLISNKQTDLNLDDLPISSIVKEVLELEGQTADEISLHFVDEKRMVALHEEFFEDPSPTDCISFPIDTEPDSQGYRVLGEVFVCPKTAKNYTAQEGGDPHQEVALYVVHGLLHLMGYDDINEEDREVMREAEARHMANLQKLRLLDSL